MKTKFTPGPWKMAANSVQTAINTEDNEKHIAMVNYNQRYMTENEHYANATLIAAAPELYNVLQEAVDEEEAYNSGKRVYALWFEKAKAVLAKARGEEVE